MSDTEHTERLHTRAENPTELNPATSEHREGDRVVFVDEIEMARLFCRFLRWPAIALAVLLVVLQVASSSYTSRRTSALEKELSDQRAAVNKADTRITAVDDFRGQKYAEHGARIRDLEGGVYALRTALATLVETNTKLDATLSSLREDWRDVTSRQVAEAAARNGLMNSVNEMLLELRKRPELTPRGQP